MSRMSVEGSLRNHLSAVRIAYPHLDFIKLLMALVVVEIHVKPLSALGIEQVNNIVSGIECVAVPFFFIASGFLCFRGLISEQFIDSRSAPCFRVRSTIKRLLFIYTVWSALLIPFSVLGYLQTNESVPRAVAYWIRGFLFVGETPYTWPLWYLLASVVGFSIVYSLLRKGVRPLRVVVVGAIALVLGYLLPLFRDCPGVPSALSAAIRAYYSVFVTVRNGFFEGFFYIALGAYIGMQLRAEKRPSFVTALVLALGGALGCILITSSPHLPFCVAFSVGVFLLSIRRVESSDDVIYRTFRNISAVIYLIHMPVILLLAYGLFGLKGPYAMNPELPLMTLYLLAVAGSSAIAAIVILASKRCPVLRKVFGI